MSEVLLEIKDLVIDYKTDDAVVHALNGLNLKLLRGETLGLVGETGAGKTTTALSVLRLLPDKVGIVKQGSIVLDGINILKATDADMRLIRGNIASMIFQDPMTSLNPLLTVSQQIDEVIEFHNIKMNNNDRSDKIDAILTMVGLSPERKHNYPHQFSGGMKQRVIIAIALACEPKLLLADEPTTALDVTVQAQVLELMNDLKAKLNTAMLLITHDLGVVAEICDRVAIMYAGEIIEICNAEDFFESEDHHPYTIGLFGSIPDMNKTSRRLSPIEGLMPDPTKLIEGCAFHPRCPKCMEKCSTFKPIMYNNNAGHQIKCHLYTNWDSGNGREGN